MKNHEHKLQSACVRWFALQYPKVLMFAIPNGGARDAATGEVLKREGVRRGIPDLFIPELRLFIEIKTPTGRVSPDQAKVHEQLKQAGYIVFVVRTVEHFIDICQSLFRQRSTEALRNINASQVETTENHINFNI